MKSKMSTRLSLAALLACTTLVQSGGALAAQATSPMKTNLVSVPEAPKSTITFPLGPGDRIQLSAYQREDLSGTFRVRPDGTVAVPLIGAVAAAGRTPAELEHDLIAAISKVTGRAVPVTVEVETWRPIYTVGDIDRPGSYPFTPGMTALHALAVAGGIFRPLREVGPLEISRQTATVVQYTERLKRALAQHARIIAEKTGQKVVEASRRLLQLAESDEVKRLMDTENAILRENQKAWRVAVEAKQQEIGHIKTEIEAYREQRTQLSRRVELVTAELGRYGKLAEKGLARSARTLQLRTEIANLEGTSHAVLASIARSERALIEANRIKETLGTTKRLELEQQLRTVEGEIQELEHSLDVIEDLVLRLSAASASPVTKSQIKRTFEIVRATGGTHEVIEATETTMLQPGDVVRVITEKTTTSEPDNAALLALPNRTR
jgi:protein involved in polysaccharide export with SLBB domain